MHDESGGRQPIAALRSQCRMLLGPCLAISIAGCLGPRSAGPETPQTVEEAQSQLAKHPPARVGSLSLNELDHVNKAFADRLAALIEAAADATLRDNPSSEQRREAYRIRAYMSQAAYNIVTRQDALSQMADLLVLTALTRRVWIDDGFLKKQFGNRAEPFASAIGKIDDEIWEAGKKALLPTQLDAIGRWIDEFRKRFPEVTMTMFVSFDDIARMRGSMRSGAGGPKDGDLVREIQVARRSVDESVVLGERVFWYFKRWPRMAAWHVELLSANLGTEPDVAKALQDFSRVSESADRLSRAIAGFPDVVERERGAFFDELNASAENADNTIKLFSDAIVQLKGLVSQLKDTGAVGKNILQESEEASRSFKELVKAFDLMIARIERISNTPSNGPAFDVRDYSATLQNLACAAGEMREFTESARGLLDSRIWSTRIAELDQVLERQLNQATSGTSGAFTSALYRGIILIAIFFACLCLYKIYAVWLERRVLGRRTDN